MVKYGRTAVTRLSEDSLAASKLLLSVSIRGGLPAILSLDARSCILRREDLILVHLTPAITWPQGGWKAGENHQVAALVHGGVRRHGSNPLK